MAECFATSILKPTIGSKLSELPPELRNYRYFKTYPRHQQLQVAMNAEYVALKDNSTWHPVTETKVRNHKAIPTQWVWTYKGDAGGYHVGDKAGMVARGNRQNQSIWHEEVYSYVVRIAALCVLLSLVAAMDSLLNDDDVVFVQLPPGCPEARKTVRLLRGMYRLS
jgi:hypothetical protein